MGLIIEDVKNYDMGKSNNKYNFVIKIEILIFFLIIVSIFFFVISIVK